MRRRYIVPAAVLEVIPLHVHVNASCCGLDGLNSDVVQRLSIDEVFGS